MRATTLGAALGGVTAGLSVAAWAFIRTYQGFALHLEHEDVFPAEVAVASTIVALLAGGVGAALGTGTGAILGLMAGRGAAAKG